MLAQEQVQEREQAQEQAQDWVPGLRAPGRPGAQARRLRED